MKKFLLFPMAALFCVTLLPSCEKSGEGDDGGPEDISKLTIEASVTDADYDGFTMLWTPGELCDHIEYAVLPSADAKGAYEAFEAGTLSGVESVATPSAEVVIPCEAIGPYTVLSRAVSAKGTKGEIVTTYATASPAGVIMTGYDDILVDLQVAIYDTEKYDKVGALVVSTAILPELGMTIDQVVELYYGAGMIPVFSNGEEFKPALNGQPDESYYIALAAVDKDDVLVDASSFEITAPPIDPSLPLPGELTIEVKDITADTARLIYTMGENTRCYYQAAITVEEYNEFMTYYPEEYENPEDYLRDYVAFFGSIMYVDDDYVWPDFTPGTEYKALGYPMNGNGPNGYGPTAMTDFSTVMSSTTTSLSPAVAEVPGVKLLLPSVKNSRTVRPVTSAAEVRKLMR